jgi:TPR repeat protein
MVKLAFCYEIGQGVEKNMNYAFNLYTQAAQSEIPQHSSRAYLCYPQGIDEERNIN